MPADLENLSAFRRGRSWIFALSSPTGFQNLSKRFITTYMFCEFHSVFAINKFRLVDYCNPVVIDLLKNAKSSGDCFPLLRSSKNCLLESTVSTIINVLHNRQHNF